MSTTRELIARLRRQLGVDAPLGPVAAPLRCEPVERRSYAPTDQDNAFRSQAAAHTTALVGIGHVGTRYATRVALQFQAELAVAHEAVDSLLSESWIEAQGLLPLQTQVQDHPEFLLRPDLGRRLNAASRELLAARAQHGVDVQPILADGLSAKACVQSGLEVLGALTQECEALGLRVGSPMCARFARVWLQDEVGELLGAKVSVIILGERPGLGTGDGLSAYLVHAPKIGKTDGDRNMISNIHARGISPRAAAQRMANLVGAMLQQGTSGVGLDLAELPEEKAGTQLRAPEVRERLVEVQR